MNEKDFKIRCEVIKNTFHDTRHIRCPTPDEDRKVSDNVYPGGDVFTTDDGDFIDLEFQMKDFDEDELVKYVEFAESLYDRHQKHVAVYVICSNDIKICVKECEIKSRANFTIKLACIESDPCELILNGVKSKIDNGEKLDDEDIYSLSMLPVMCDDKDRNFYRKEYLRIINNHY